MPRNPVKRDSVLSAALLFRRTPFAPNVVTTWGVLWLIWKTLAKPIGLGAFVLN